MSNESTADVRELRRSPKKLTAPKNPLADASAYDTIEAVVSVLTFLRFQHDDSEDLAPLVRNRVGYGRRLVHDCMIEALEHAQAQLVGRQEVQS